MAADEPVRGRRDHDLAGQGDVLQPDRHVTSLADDRHCVRRRLHDGNPGVDADPGLQLGAVVAAEPRAEALQVLENAQTGPDGARAASSWATG